MTAPMISFVIRKRDSSDEITAIADAGTFDTLTDNLVGPGRLLRQTPNHRRRIACMADNSARRLLRR
jgi:hypothetical protein